MIDNLINNTREKCVITNSNDIETIFILKDFPIFIGNTKQKIEDDLFSNMIFDISKKCGVIQLKNTINPNLIYSQYHSEAIGNVWENHNIKFSELLINLINNNNIKNVLEIGGSTAKLAKMILNNNNSVDTWTIVEPNIPKQNEIIDERINFISDFFKSELIREKYDLIIHSHTLEHMFNPNEFLNEINKCLITNGLQVFSVPNLLSYLKNRHPNILNFEHTIFLSEEIIDYLLLKNKFEILYKENYLEHSIFFVTKENQIISEPEIPNKYEEYKNMFNNYIEHYQMLISEINHKINQTNSDVYLFGGHVFSQFLISIGLNTEKIKYILDNSQMKNNTRLYGTNLIIKNPNDVDIKDNSIIILKVGNYKDEIISGLLSINPTIKFLE
jgi:2-polyprenyl-3-methyl-5-hydroxy-6-metoxy-1,4-benzoquinol methylase